MYLAGERINEETVLAEADEPKEIWQEIEEDQQMIDEAWQGIQQTQKEIQDAWKLLKEKKQEKESDGK